MVTVTSAQDGEAVTLVLMGRMPERAVAKGNWNDERRFYILLRRCWCWFRQTNTITVEYTSDAAQPSASATSFYHWCA